MEKMFQFVRPIYWINDSKDYLYTIGGTACILKHEGAFYLISARHALNKPDRDIQEAFIHYRLDSMYPIKIGLGANFIPKSESADDAVYLDVQVHAIPQFHPKESPLTKDEYVLFKDDYVTRDPYRDLYLSGCAHQERTMDYDNRFSSAISATYQGQYGGDDPTSSRLGIFEAPALVGVDINGMSGGAISSIHEGRPVLESIVLQGGGNPDIDYVRIVEPSIFQTMILGAITRLKEATSLKA